jgi:hypothetical protein
VRRIHLTDLRRLPPLRLGLLLPGFTYPPRKPDTRFPYNKGKIAFWRIVGAGRKQRKGLEFPYNTGKITVSGRSYPPPATNLKWVQPGHMGLQTQRSGATRHVGMRLATTMAAAKLQSSGIPPQTLESKIASLGTDKRRLAVEASVTQRARPYRILRVQYARLLSLLPPIACWEDI